MYIDFTKKYSNNVAKELIPNKCFICDDWMFICGFEKNEKYNIAICRCGSSISKDPFISICIKHEFYIVHPNVLLVFR